MPTELLAELRAHKVEVLALLSAVTDPPPVTHNDNIKAPPAAEVIHGLPDAEWVDAMAEALAANPVYTIANRESAMVYFRGRALAMLDATPDPYARGLMLGWERHRHVGGVPTSCANGAKCDRGRSPWAVGPVTSQPPGQPLEGCVGGTV